MFSWEAMQPKLEKLDPIKGIPRLFAVRGLVELLKSLVKFLLVFAVVVVLYRVYFNQFRWGVVNNGPISIINGLSHA